MDKPKLSTRMKSFGLQCKRVWHILRKPTRKEFTSVAKVSAIGILVIGAAGFLIALVMNVIVQ